MRSAPCGLGAERVVLHPHTNIVGVGVHGKSVVESGRWNVYSKDTMMRRLALFLLIAALCSGCTRTNREDLAKEVLKADPEFGIVLDKHRELSNRIETYERELALKRTTVERTITQLRHDLATTTDTVRNKTAEAKKKMEPDHKRLELALAMAAEQLQAQRVQRASLGRQITQLRKAVKTGGAAWSESERSQQEAKITEMLRDAQRLDQEMAVLKQHVRLIKIKLLLIKL